MGVRGTLPVTLTLFYCKKEKSRKFPGSEREVGSKGMEKEECNARGEKRGTTVKWKSLGYQCLLYRIFLYFILNAK